MATQTASSGLGSVTARQWLILLMVQLCTLLFGMTITLANVVLPQIKGAMSATQDQIAWVITFNLIATAIGTPLVGWLASRLGWRTVMFGSALGFTISSLLCAFATSLETLVLFRVGQGLFGAPIMPMGQAIVLATFPRHQHALMMMIWGIGAVIGPVTGPVVGSFVSELYGWRMAFLMIVPPGILATVCCWFALSEHTSRSPTYFDWTGFIALSVAIAAAQLIMDRGNRLDWFDSTEIWIELLVAICAFWVFIVHTFSARKPFLDPTLLLDRNFALGLIVAFIMGALSFTAIALFPGLLHDLRGYPDSSIGLLLAARGIGNWTSFLVIVPMTRLYPRTTLAIGLGCQAIAGLGMAHLDINLTDFDVFWTNALQGFGFGLAFTPMSVLAFATLDKGRITDGMSVFHLVRNFGSSLFISLSIVVLVRSTAASYSAFTEHISPFNRVLAYPGAVGLWNLESQGGLLALAGELQRQAAMIGYINAFYLFAFTAALSVPVAFLMRDVPRDRTD
ncbi:MAG TPA: DHA2 family efflux MFS transporter permease subunit [Hyphomicrobiaceae bacterium]|nr:DHA2 family efflux MFS transporter permease subunit [Hyphomicrobiaceae bacterium]